MYNTIMGVLLFLVVTSLLVFISWKGRCRKTPHEIEQEIREKQKYLAWLNRANIQDSWIEEDKERILLEIHDLEKERIDYYAERYR